MKNFQTVVQELLHNHERQRRYIALLTALCMLMAFTVSIILIEPAESMTGELACGMSEHIHNENCFTYTCGLENDASHVHSADCRTLTCGKTEHAHSENCYIHEDEQTAQIMQINSPQFIDNDMPEGDSGISSHTDTSKDAWLDENQAFKEALKEPPEGAHEIKYDPANPENDEVTGLEVSVNGVNVQKDSDVYHIESQSDSQKVKFLLHYTIDKSFIKEDGNQYIYIKIPDGFDIPESWCGINRVVVDEEYMSPNSDHTAGYFSIDKDTRMLVIRFTDDYVTKKLSDSGTFSGKVEFEGSFNRDNTADGDKEFTLWNDKIVINFPEKTYYAEKEGKIKPADDSEKNPKVEWTITVNNYYPEDSENTLTGYTVRDERFPAGGTGVTIEPEGVDLGTWKTDENGKTYFKFNDGVRTDKVTFTFTKELTQNEVDAKQVSNTVDLQKNGSSVSTKNVDITVDDKPTLDKKGVAKYPVDGKDYIEWTITVTNPLGGSLKDYYLTDDAFENMTEKDITISPTGTPFEFTPTDKKLKFTSDVTDVTITYRQFPTPEHGSYYSNNVELYKDNNRIGFKSDGLNYYERYKLDKSGDYNADTKEITWTVKADLSDHNDTNVTLNGYTLQDNALIGKLISDITIKNSSYHGSNLQILRTEENKIIFGAKEWQSGSQVDVEYAEVALDSNTGTITITGKNEKSLHSLEFTYTTGTTGTGLTKNDDDEVTNTVTDSKGESATGKVPVGSRNFVEKKLLGDENNKTKADVYGKENRTLNWQVDLTQDEGFSGTKTFVDVMSATNGGDHYLDLDVESQKNSIQLWAKVNDSDDWTPLTKDEDYEIKYYNDPSDSTGITTGHANRFEIEFLEAMKSKGYHYVEITYQTTADISKAEFDEVATFNNTARYNGTENPPITGYEITPHDSSKVQTFSLNVTKSWKDNENAAGIRPDSVKFYLERKLGSGDWEKIYKNDSNEWVEVTTDTPEDEYTFTIEKDSWTKELAGLPIDTKEHDEKYFYRVKEVGVDEDIYTVTYSDNEQGVSGTVGVDSTTITITNTKNMTFDKVVLGADGQPLEDGKLDLNALGPVEITEEHNGTKTTGSYYIIGYQFTIDAAKEDAYRWEQFTDTLPKGFELVFSEDENGGSQATAEKQYYPTNEPDSWRYCLKYSSDNITTEENFTYNKTDNQVIFTLNSNKPNKVIYYIKAPADEFGKQFKSAVEKTVTVKNTITGPDDTSKSAEVKVTGQIKDNPLRDILKKDVNNISENGRHKSDNGVVSYSVYVNPEGKNLSNSDELDVLDDLIFGDFTGIEGFDKNKLTAELQSVQVEKVENFRMENGSPKADSVEILPESDYSYTTEENIVENWEGDVEYKLDSKTVSGSGGYDYKYSTQSGEKITITIVGTPGYKFSDGSYFTGITNTGILSGRTIPESGILSFEMETNSTSISLWFNQTNCDNIKSISITAHKTITTDIASRLTVSVPDETPLKITYSYKLMYDNQELSGDVTAKLSNKASITSGTSTATDSKNDVEFYVNKVESTVGTGNLPKIVKYNIGNVATNPSAIFYLAKYENSKWKFANEETTEEIKSSSGEKIGTKHTFTYGKEVSDNSIPPSKDESNSDGALKLQITDADPFYLELDSSVLYKLIEIKAPDDYEANDTDINTLSSGTYKTLQALLEGELNSYLSNPEYNTVYKNLLDKFIAVHYFKYGSQEVPADKMPSMPEKSKYQVVGIGGSVEIPNSELIDIKATKTWDSDVNGSINVELWWSTKKNLNVNDPNFESNAKKVLASELGIIGDFNAEKTINGNGTVSWENLPNGYDDKPIYYYVRETSYTINGEKFEWNKDTGKYMCGEKEGEYKPIYTGNGTNKSAKPDSTRSGESTATDNGVIKIHNSKGLQVKKIWKNSDNTTMATADIPNVEIKFNLYGTTSDGVTEWIYQGTLRKDNWTAEIPENLPKNNVNSEINPSNKDLSDYVSFEVEELIEGELITKLYQYTISYNYNISGTTGEITITNKNPNPTKVDVSVEKVWSDGNSGHSSDNITVTLYRSTTSFTDEQLGSLDTSNPEGLTKVEGEGITNPFTLNNSNNWENTWNDLPYKDSSGQRYYYYVLETTGKTGYTASYFVNGNKTTITNSVPGSLTIDKKWLSTDGKNITSDIKNPVNFKLYRRANSSAAADDSKTLNGLKIYAFGDSITAGTGVNETERYSNLLQEKLKANGTNITVENKSQSGAKIAITDVDEWNTIEGFIKNNLNDDYGVVIVMAGTNNVLNTKDTIDEMKNKMSGLLDMVYSKDKNSNLVVFLEKIPKIIDFENDGNVHPGNRFDGDNLQESEYQGKWNELVTKYNEMLDDLVKGYQEKYPERKIIVVDTYTAVGENFYRDSYAKIHPDKVGHQKIAELLYREILDYYGIEGSKAPVDIKGLPSDFYKSDGSVNPLYEEVTDKAFTLPDNGSWSKTFTNLDTKNGTDDYVYYIVEESTGNWTAAYTGNGQIINDSGATIKVTNTIDKGSIDVEKVWENSNHSQLDPSLMQSIEVQLYRSTIKPPTDSELRTSSIMNEPMALALDDSEYDTVTVTEGLTLGARLELSDLVSNTTDLVKIKFEFSKSFDGHNVAVLNGSDTFTGAWTNNPQSTVFEWNEDKTVLYVSSFPNGFNAIICDSVWDIELTSVTFYYPKGTLGGTTPEPNPPTQTHGDTELTFESGDGTTKIAQITGASIGDKIIVHLAKDAITVGASGSFGYSIDDSEHDNWCNYTWNYTDNVAAGIATVSIDIDSQVAIGTDRDDITFTWTVPDDYKTNGTIEFQIWKNCNESNLSSATYTIQNSTITEPDTPTDNHIPTDAVKVGDPVELKTGNWKHTFDNLPLTDASGNPYYYYVKEVNVPDGFEVTYSDGVEPGGTITITNTKKESSTTTMPSTGGNGAGKYYTVGGMLLLMSACGWAMHRRKRVIPH